MHNCLSRCFSQLFLAKSINIYIVLLQHFNQLLVPLFDLYTVSEAFCLSISSEHMDSLFHQSSFLRHLKINAMVTIIIKDRIRIPTQDNHSSIILCYYDSKIFKINLIIVHCYVYFLENYKYSQLPNSFFSFFLFSLDFDFECDAKLLISLVIETIFFIKKFGFKSLLYLSYCYSKISLCSIQSMVFQTLLCFTGTPFHVFLLK